MLGGGVFDQCEGGGTGGGVVRVSLGGVARVSLGGVARLSLGDVVRVSLGGVDLLHLRRSFGVFLDCPNTGIVISEHCRLYLGQFD